MAEPEINPASDGPWTCPKCNGSFSTWQGFLRHGRTMKHFASTASMKVARKRYVGARFHKAHPEYNRNAARDAKKANSQPAVATHPLGELYWVTRQSFQDGFLMVLRPRSRDESEIYYAVPAALKFNMPKPKVP